MSQTEKITVTNAYMDCFMCPTTIIGRTFDGSTVYARYRWGHLSIRLDHRDPPPHGGASGKWIMEKQLDPTGLGGCLDYAELREITAHIVEWPDELSSPDENERNLIDMD